MAQHNTNTKSGLLKTLVRTATDLTQAVQEEFPKVAPKVTEELSKVLDESKNISSLSNMLEMVDEKIRGITHAAKEDIEQKVMIFQKQIQRQFLYQWIVIGVGIGIVIIIAFSR